MINSKNLSAFWKFTLLVAVGYCVFQIHEAAAADLSRSVQESKKISIYNADSEQAKLDEMERRAAIVQMQQATAAVPVAPIASVSREESEAPDRND